MLEPLFICLGTAMHEEYMKLALDEARRGLKNEELPIGAVVVANGKVVSRAHPRDKQGGLLQHAELLALQEADNDRPRFSDRRQTTLYTTLEPCLMCFGASMSYFVGKIVYSLQAPADGALSLVDDLKVDHPSFQNYQLPEVTGGLLEKESCELMKEYVLKYERGPLVEFAKGIVDHFETRP